MLREGLRSGVEEDVVERFFVVEGDRGDGLGQSEDNMETSGEQQLVLSLLEPFWLSQSLALGTVPVAAGAVADVRVLAAVAEFDHAAQLQVRQLSSILPAWPTSIFRFGPPEN